MTMTSSCLSTELLQQLVTGELPAAEQDELVAHIDHCLACQARLEAVAGGGSGLSNVALAVGKASHSHETSLLQLLADLKTNPDVTRIHRPNPATDWIQSFLQPAVSLDLLGTLETYEVMEMLGQGGMGVVLKAYEPALRRPVAIKVLSPHLASDPKARKRFAREAQATAAVRHENVVAIHAVSEANGLPFIVMEYVDGGSLQEYLHQYGPLDWRTAVQVGVQLASGLAAAHAQGLVHRDIKPSNILLQTRNGEPGTGNGETKSRSEAFPIPKIGDFGLARVADGVQLTQSGVVAGTPMYMAPEQALGGRCDARADLFSLGSLLYTLCTGEEPFAAVTPLAVMHRVCETEPQPIAELNPTVPEWVIGAIERLHVKDPDHRLGSAAEVAELFRAYLAHREQPELVPEPRLTATHKPMPKSRWRRRWIALGTALLLLGGLTFSEAMGWTRIKNAVVLGWAQDEEAPVVLRATFRGNKGPIWSADFSPDGQTVATGGDDGSIRLWNLEGQQLASLTGHGTSVYALHFAPSSDLLISGDDDGKVKLWKVSERRLGGKLRDKTGAVRAVALSPDQRTIAAGGSDHEVELWDVAGRKLLRTLPGHRSTVSSVVFSPDAKALASGDTGGHITIWDLAENKKRLSFQADPLRVRALVFLADSAMLASAGSGDRSIKLWRTDTGELAFTFPGHLRGVNALAIASDGRRLASARRNGTIKFWDVQSRQGLGNFQAHQGNVWSIAFSPDGRSLVSAGEDRLGKLWDISAVQPPP